MSVQDPLSERQRARLEQTVEWARKIGNTLGPLLDVHGDRVHFRPSSGGIAMIGLLQDRPQRGRSGLQDVDWIVENFESLFMAYCRDIYQGRPTVEKRLQSFLIREARKNQGRMVSLEGTAQAIGEPVELSFMTDEIALPIVSGRIVCDLLALRTDHGRNTPVLIELKTRRELTRLVEQVEAYASLIDQHAELFASLFQALTGNAIRFDHPAEKWIIWPATLVNPDPRAAQLQAKDIRSVGFRMEPDGGYRFEMTP